MSGGTTGLATRPDGTPTAQHARRRRSRYARCAVRNNQPAAGPRCSIKSACSNTDTAHSCLHQGGGSTNLPSPNRAAATTLLQQQSAAAPIVPSPHNTCHTQLVALAAVPTATEIRQPQQRVSKVATTTMLQHDSAPNSVRLAAYFGCNDTSACYST